MERKKVFKKFQRNKGHLLEYVDMRTLVEKICDVESHCYNPESLSLAEKVWHSFQRVEAGDLKLAGVTLEDVREILHLGKDRLVAENIRLKNIIELDQRKAEHGCVGAPCSFCDWESSCYWLTNDEEELDI